MIPDTLNPRMPPDEVDFETALTDPAAYYAHPADIVGDDQLSHAQKRRFLEEWAQDVSDRQQAADEGMDSVNSAETASDADILRKIHVGLEQLGGEAGTGHAKPGRSFWKRLMPF